MFAGYRYIPYLPVVKTPSPWAGGRNYRLTYPEDDEGSWDGTWTFKKVVVAAAVMGAFDIVLILDISPGRNKKVTAYKLTMARSNNTVTQAITLCFARCTSIADAQEHADRVIYRHYLRELYRKIYSRLSAFAIFTATAEPVCTAFDGITAQLVDELRHSHVTTTFYCFSRSRGAVKLTIIPYGFVTETCKPETLPTGVFAADPSWIVLKEWEK